MPNVLLQLFFLLLPLIAHLVHDVIKINNNKSPAHALDAFVIFALSVLAGFSVHFWAEPKVYWWQYIIFALTIHFFFFNYLLNILRKPGKSLFYLGDGPWDSFLAYFGPPPFRIFFQSIILLTGYGVYVHLDWIINR